MLDRILIAVLLVGLLLVPYRTYQDGVEYGKEWQRQADYQVITQLEMKLKAYQIQRGE